MSTKVRSLLFATVFLTCVFFVNQEDRILHAVDFIPPGFVNLHRPGINQKVETTSPTIIAGDKALENILRTRAQCLQDFPDLYHAVASSASHYRNHPLRRADLEKAFESSKDDFTWVVIRNNEVFVRSRHGGFQSRVQAVLADLHRAIITSPERLPDVEFLFSTADSGPSEKYTPVFGLSRGLKERAFLIPDFGYWAWPEPHVNGFMEFENEVERVEHEVPWAKKKNQLFWRGAAKMNPEREHLVRLSEQHNTTWGNVRDINWGDLKEDDRYDMADHCRFKFLAHIEGARYSARLKYLQHCKSVIVTHEQKWTTHLSHLLNDDGVGRNVVVVSSGFKGVEKVMEDLLLNEEKAEKIAKNSQETFGKLYGRLGAEVCYWRQLIRGYHSIMTPEFQRSVSSGYDTKSMKDYESVMLMGKTEWAIS